MVHDVRQLSDILHHQFQVTLVNVFDTMAAHLVVANWEADNPRRNLEVAPALEDTLRRFLKRPDLELGPLGTGSSQAAVSRRCRLKAISNSSFFSTFCITIGRWRLRALPYQLLLEDAVSVFLLLPLATMLEQKLLEPVSRTSEALLDDVLVNSVSITVAFPLWEEDCYVEIDLFTFAM